MIGFSQGVRTERDRNLPQWELAARDRRYADQIRNRNENPAIMQRLDEIEAKLNRVIAYLDRITPAS